MPKPEIRTVNVTRYVTPLREGGSLPAIVEADDDFPYVLKFRGAGQGKKALIAELLGGELARAMGLKVPELVFMMLDESFSQTEPDEEIQDLLKFSVGLNLGLHYLSGAITYDPVISEVDALTASKVVLLDSIITNVDRTHRNTNMLMWYRELWLIDHGASFYFHHSWGKWEEHLDKPFPLIANHVLLKQAKELEQAELEIRTAVNEQAIRDIVSVIPDDWLIEEGDEASAEEKREVYASFLITRINHLEQFTKAAADARKAGI